MRKLNEFQVRELVKRRLENQTQMSLALELGISASYLCDFLQGRRAAGEKIANGLGLRREVLYVSK